MTPADDAANVEIGQELRSAVGLLYRRIKQAHLGDALSLSGVSAVSRLNRVGPMTAAQLAKLEQVTPQSMAATVSDLEGRGLITRSADPSDGRRLILSLTERGRDHIAARRNARDLQITSALADGFSPAELATLRAAAPLLERLAHVL